MSSLNHRLVSGASLYASPSTSVSERIDFTRLDGDAKGSVENFLETAALNNLMAASHEIYADILPVKTRHVVSYDVTKAEQKGELFYYLQQAQAQNLSVALELAGATEEDIKALADYSAIIKYLDLHNSSIENGDALGHLTALQYLNLSGTQVSDVSALSNLLQLQTLYLTGTQVSDVSALSNLLQLQTLYLTGTQVSDVSALSNLTQLRDLYLSGTPVSDVSILDKLIQLQYLYLNGTPVSDVTALRNLSQLQALYLIGTLVSDIGALSNLTQLQTLYLNGTQVSDVTEFVRKNPALTSWLMN